MSNSTNSTAGYAPFDLYPYNPSQPAAYAFMGLFGFAAVIHLLLMIPYRVWFPLPMVIGCAMEAVGYYFRSAAHDNERKIAPYIIQYLMIFVAPPMLAAVVYMSPGRILRGLRAEECFVLHPQWQTKLFVLIDTVCFATQFAGAIMSGSEDTNEASQGMTIILTGLIIQVGAFGLFIITLLVSHRRLAHRDHGISTAPKMHWKGYFYGLYAISALFLIRNAVRIVEHKQGNNGTIASTEAYLYAFDAVFMLAVVVILILLHPGRLVRKATRSAKVGNFESGLELE
ncbi:hypothetical protein E8E14_002459 [Neopestalotiopsis sp. 37M]|nr:hypothetical protein E8E14_002459 [Neopestalotiopsis sp. 37M]